MTYGDVTTDGHRDGEPRAAHDECVDDTVAVEFVEQAHVVATAVAEDEHIHDYNSNSDSELFTQYICAKVFVCKLDKRNQTLNHYWSNTLKIDHMNVSDAM